MFLRSTKYKNVKNLSCFHVLPNFLFRTTTEVRVPQVGNLLYGESLSFFASQISYAK